MDDDTTNENKDSFIAVTCCYSTSARNLKKNNYVIKTKHFETGTREDVLRLYMTLQEISGKKSCDDADTKFGIVEVLLDSHNKKYCKR